MAGYVECLHRDEMGILRFTAVKINIRCLLLPRFKEFDDPRFMPVISGFAVQIKTGVSTVRWHFQVQIAALFRLFHGKTLLAQEGIVPGIDQQRGYLDSRKELTRAAFFIIVLRIGKSVDGGIPVIELPQGLYGGEISIVYLAGQDAHLVP